MVVLVIAVAACASPAAVTTVATATRTSAPPTAREARRDLPNCGTPLTAIYAVHVEGVDGGQTGDAIYCATVGGVHDVNTRLLEWPVAERSLLAADDRILIQLDVASHGAAAELSTFAPDSGATRTLETLGDLGVGDSGPVGAVMSPDGTEFALGSAHKLLIVSVDSGAARTIASAPADRWLMPLRWTAAGIVVHNVDAEPSDFGLMIIDPLTGSITAVNDGPNVQLTVSPDGRYRVSTTNANLGDGPWTNFPWQNVIELTGPDGKATRLASHKDRWFVPLDVTDTGQVLFAVDTENGVVAPDMGLYMARDGRVTQQLPLHFHDEWQAARFVNGSTALVAHLIGGTGDAQTGLGLEVVEMCNGVDPGCQPETSGDTLYSGRWETTIRSLVMLGQS